MVTIQVDLLEESFTKPVTEAGDYSAFIRPLSGMAPDKVVVVQPYGPGGGNPFCHVSFEDETTARRWFAIIADDPSPSWFDENVV